MYFKLSALQEKDLLNQPETGMGYQIVEASKAGSYTREKFLVLNSEVVIEMNGYEGNNVRKIINEGIFSIKVNAKFKEIQFVQKEIEDDVFIIYLKVSDVSKVNSIEVKNTLLFDFITEQQNIIHTQVLNKKQSALLTPDNPNELLNY